MSTQELNQQRLSSIHPLIAKRALKFINACEAKGVHILITQALRTIDQQNALYAQGRTTKGNIVTWAKGGQSYHNYGLAIDFVPLDAIGKADWDVKHPAWKAAIDSAKALGFESGADWKTLKDFPHLQIICGMTLTEARTLNRFGGLPSVWGEITKRLG